MIEEIAPNNLIQRICQKDEGRRWKIWREKDKSVDGKKYGWFRWFIQWKYKVSHQIKWNLKNIGITTSEASELLKRMENHRSRNTMFSGTQNLPKNGFEVFLQNPDFGYPITIIFIYFNLKSLWFTFHLHVNSFLWKKVLFFSCKWAISLEYLAML